MPTTTSALSAATPVEQSEAYKAGEKIGKPIGFVVGLLLAIWLFRKFFGGRK